MASQPLAVFASQLPKPTAHVKAQAPPVHLTSAFATAGHTAHAAPQARTSLSGTHAPAQACVAAGHVALHAPATHEAAPPSGTGHAVQASPQAVASSSATHLSAHAWNLGLHVVLHTPAAQATIAFATSAHLRLQPPQWFALVIGSTHAGPHLTGASAGQPLVHWNVGPTGAQSGASAAHAALHAPQLVGLERSLSQPSVALALQSAYPGLHFATMHLRP